MLKLYKPELRELGFRQQLLADEQTMSYNRRWGGSIAFPTERWEAWYHKWIGAGDEGYFYRYLFDQANGVFVGEAAYHFEENTGRCLCDLIIHAQLRNRGYGHEGLELLCAAAAEKGIAVLYDDIANDNPSVALFLKNGFQIVSRDKDSITVRKYLTENSL